MTALPFTSAALDEIANHLVCERDTHRLLDQKFAELGISEPARESSPQEEAYLASGLRSGIDYVVSRPSKRERLRYASDFLFRRSGNNGVLHLIKILNEPVVYAGDLDGFTQFSSGLNRILRLYGLEYRDDGEFHEVAPARTLTEAELRARALENKIASRRVHSEVRRYCREQYTQDNYFEAVVEAYKGLAERIREKTGQTIDGTQLMRQSFERPPARQGGYAQTRFQHTYVTDNEKNELLLDFWTY